MYLADQLDPARLQRCEALARVEHHVSIASTQDRARELARAADPGPLPLLVVAEQQTAGRGRGDNRWWTGTGSLAMSLLFDPENWELPRGPVPARALVTAVAIVDTVQPHVDARVGLHWPNDVYMTRRKLAGVLVDVLGSDRHVIGIGLNVNNSLQDAPDDIRTRAISLCDYTGRTFDRNELLLNLVTNLKASLQAAAADPETFGRRYQELCLQVDEEITIESGAKRTTGRCAGIQTDGGLVLETAAGRQTSYSGVLLR